MSPGGGVALAGYFRAHGPPRVRDSLEVEFSHACRNQSNITTLKQIGSIKTSSSTRPRPPSISPVIILARIITSSRRVLAASSSAFLKRCRSGGTGSRIFQVSVEAAREKLFFHHFSFDDCSYPRATSTPNDSDALPLRKLFSATGESSGQKINKSSRFLSVLQAVRFPSALSRIGSIFPLSGHSRFHQIATARPLEIGEGRAVCHFSRKVEQTSNISSRITFIDKADQEKRAWPAVHAHGHQREILRLPLPAFRRRLWRRWIIVAC